MTSSCDLKRRLQARFAAKGRDPDELRNVCVTAISRPYLLAAVLPRDVVGAQLASPESLSNQLVSFQVVMIHLWFLRDGPHQEPQAPHCPAISRGLAAQPLHNLAEVIVNHSGHKTGVAGTYNHAPTWRRAPRHWRHRDDT